MVCLIITLVNSINLEEIFGKWVKKSKADNSNIVSSVTSAELTKLYNKPSVVLCWTLGEKPLEPEPQPQSYKIMKQWQEISKWNGYGTLLNKTDKKLYVFGGSGFKLYGKCTVTNKK